MTVYKLYSYSASLDNSKNQYQKYIFLQVKQVQNIYQRVIVQICNFSILEISTCYPYDCRNQLHRFDNIFIHQNLKNESKTYNYRKI